MTAKNILPSKYQYKRHYYCLLNEGPGCSNDNIFDQHCGDFSMTPDNICRSRITSMSNFTNCERYFSCSIGPSVLINSNAQSNLPVLFN
ncbi:hypothetical protein PanWU01x14_289920 [Parasponia andersonii]|uniref:Uncharacterized protein n=1 Tax=Parasponia andersonii TaxID=3476 RepID=A0A2P5AY12_PARAD|nr:hypothetical protein PanWU01x14_289920 [Parasponia andersonii]